ncbi:MAG: LacI family DNA-binding transcriptional regulator [Lachnospiraceae bacterium]|nr:LacI family DNA-binding transcriptional regulator [Lachnospiraceae bacterium]MDY2629372.1 LacI family DNA-binding transcriptional regulator [Lachnospiraceae bacterium]MDY4968722.1 LacI family DNA-binding transcriptional regulator [Lachnospiraceae bacterium]
MITIKEIAEMMNVSPTTVANVIHGRTNKVSKENVERIQKALKDYNYVPRMGLESLTKGKSRIILVVAHLTRKYSLTYLSDPFFGYIVGVMEEIISNAGYYMMLYINKENKDITSTAMSWNVAGIITITFSCKNFKKLSALADCPIVGIDTYGSPEELKEGHHVKLDDAEAGRLMARYLISRGFKNIITITDDADVQKGSSLERMDGIHEVLKEYHLPCSHPGIPDIIYLDPLDIHSYAKLDQLFPFAGQNYVLFCTSDQFAFSIIGYLTRQGMRVPEDFSVCGFDDNAYASFSNPQLTTVHQDIKKKAETALDILFSLIAGKDIEDCITYLPVKIIPRNSTQICNKDNDH